jgi:uncharacterized protein (TIGR03089 family)
VTTFSTLLDSLLKREPGRPLITFYDHDSGERTELSVVTYANWVAKTASLLVEEYDAERGDRLRLELPTHWLGPVFLGAAWSAGLEVAFDGPAGVVVCGPAAVSELADTLAPETASGAVTLIATALHPMATRFTDELPEGVHDFGVEVWGQPDSFVAWDPPTAADPALKGVTHEELWSVSSAPQRWLSVANPASPEGARAFATALGTGGSLVLVAHPDAERLEAAYVTERASATWTDQPTRS